MCENICEAIHRELHKLDEKYANGTQLSDADLKDFDIMVHALKSHATYEAMKGDSGYYGGDSYARGRSRTTGRYVSRDGGYAMSRENENYGGGPRW